MRAKQTGGSNCTELFAFISPLRFLFLDSLLTSRQNLFRINVITFFKMKLESKTNATLLENNCIFDGNLKSIRISRIFFGHNSSIHIQKKNVSHGLSRNSVFFLSLVSLIILCSIKNSFRSEFG